MELHQSFVEKTIPGHKKKLLFRVLQMSCREHYCWLIIFDGLLVTERLTSQEIKAHFYSALPSAFMIFTKVEAPFHHLIQLNIRTAETD